MPETFPLRSREPEVAAHPCVVGFAVWPERSHIFPTLHLTQKLREKGAEVIHFGTPDSEPFVREQGFVFRRAAPAPNDPSLANKTRKEKSRFFADLVPSFMAEIKNAGLTHLFVDPLINGAAIAGVRAGVDVRYFWTLNPPYEREQHLPLTYSFRARSKHLARFSKLMWLPQSMRWRWWLLTQVRNKDPMHALMKEAAAERKIKTVLTSYGFRMDLPAFVLGPRRFEQSPDSSLTYLGLGVDRSRRQDAFVPTSAAPLVYVSLGGNFTLYPLATKVVGSILEAAAQLPHLSFLVQAPVAVHGKFKVPGNVTLVNSAPTLAVLERASAAIIHGGYGSIKECILFGVPMLIVPFFFDQPANAAKVEELGIGYAISPQQATAAAIRQGLQSLLGAPDAVTRIKAFRDAVVQEDQYERFCTEIVGER